VPLQRWKAVMAAANHLAKDASVLIQYLHKLYVVFISNFLPSWCVTFVLQP
jgi:hypothetical protein